MNVALLVSLYVLRVYNVHLIEFLSSLGAVLEHGTHGGVSVYVGVFTLYVVVLGFLKCEVLIYSHELGVHVPYSGALRSVKDKFLGGTGVSVFYEDFFYGVLNLLYGRYIIVAYLQQI